MEIKAPVLSSINVKAERGLTGDAYLSRDDSFIVDLIAAIEGVALKAGEETPVAVPVAGLPSNANLQTITAKLTVAQDQQAGTTQSSSVTEGSDQPRSFQVTVDNVPGIRNVQIRLNQGTVFWTHTGALQAGTYAIPDFSAQANTYLDKYHSQDGKVTLQFLVKSDVAGHVTIDIDPGFKFSLLQTQSWKNDLDSTFRVDRTLKLTFNQTTQLPIDAVTVPAGSRAAITQVRLDAGGQFGPERLLGAVETHDGHQYATVSSDFSIAQQATPVKSMVKTAIQCTGIAGYFEADGPAEFYVELQNDQNGSPAGDTPLAKSNVSFQPADPNDPQPWTFAKFEKPAELKPDTPYWIVSKGVRGAVRLGITGTAADPSGPVTRGPLLLNRGSQIWKAYSTDSLVGLLSLVYVPQPDNQTAAIEISVDGVPQRIDPQSAAKTINFPVSSSSVPQLVVDSRALGSLTVANVIQEYTLA
jgi:hypothetical protein